MLFGHHVTTLIKKGYVQLLCFITLLSMGSLASAGSGVTASNFGSGTAQTQYNAGSNLKNVSKNATTSFEMVWVVICSGATLVGLAFALAGFMRLKKSQDQSSGVTATSGWWLIGIGACLVVLPWMIFTGANILTTNPS